MELKISNAAFWDTDLKQMDEVKNAPFIITRVFQFGLIDDIREIIRAYSPEQIRDSFRGKRGIDPKAISLAALLLNLNESELK